MSEMCDVSIILVNYRHSDLLYNVIKSVKDMSNFFTYEIIVVDNSNDESCAITESKLANDIVYVNAYENLGFGKANNLGAKYSSGKYLFFLNTDTLLINNAIYELLIFMEKFKYAGIAGSNLYTPERLPNHSFCINEKNIKNEKKELSFFKTIFSHFSRKRKDFNYSNNALEVFGYVCGASLMIRKTVFDELGGFDKDIFLYAEESLLCYRLIHETDLKVFNVPSSKIIHFEGGSTQFQSLFQFKSLIDGNCIYFSKTGGKKAVLMYLKLRIKYLKKELFFSCFVASFDKKLITEKLNYCKTKLLTFY